MRNECSFVIFRGQTIKSDIKSGKKSQYQWPLNANPPSLGDQSARIAVRHFDGTRTSSGVWSSILVPREHVGPRRALERVIRGAAEV